MSRRARWSVRGAAVAGALAAFVGCEAEPDLGKPPTVCSTKAVNAGESPEMEPGGDCIGCHASAGEGPSFLVAGTVMAALHDDTNCGGVAGVTVRLTGADGQKLELTTNSTGNFFVEKGKATLALPFNAEVEVGGKVQKMLTAQSNTNCMACHTAEGSMLAIGRIVPPTP
jgi:mono/diheme cytochrome c family protein